MNMYVKLITFSLVFLLSTLSHALAQSVPQLANKALAATVSLTVQDRNGNTLRKGSGFFIQEDLIATTSHVIEGDVRVSAILANSETKHRTHVTATDEANNLALLKVRGHGITPLDLADSDEVRIGETVYVPQFSLGTVSASAVRNRRNIGTRKERLRMTDSIWAGNRGAPLLNLEGKVIGMFVSNYGAKDNQTSNLAIPSNALKAMLTRPSRGGESEGEHKKPDSFDSRPTVPQLAKKALAATVSLQMQDENGVTQGRGSGFFVRRNLIATNFHVIDGATNGTVRLVNTKTTYRIEGVTAKDESNDLALLKVTLKSVTPLLLGDSDAVEVGETVYAAGNPLGFEGTFSDGVISGRRDSATNNERLQMTAPISPGSSGGPVINREGEVIGVSTLVYNPLFGQNLNFAVPSKALKALLAQSGEAKPMSTRNASFSHSGYLLRGNAKSLSGDYEGAIREFTQAIRLNPNYVSAYVNRGIAKSDLGKLYAAIADYDVAISLDPNYSLAYVARGVAKRKLGKYHAAIADFDTAIRMNPDADTYIHRGIVKAELRQYTAAIADYDIAIRINRHDALAYTFRGFSKGKLGQHIAAIADYDAALRLDPNSVSTY